MSKNDVSGFHEKEFKELLRKGICNKDWDCSSNHQPDAER